jgi:hypothetical protein
MQQKQEIIVPKLYLTLLNHLYEIERKTSGLDEFKKISRNVERMKSAFKAELNGSIDDTGLTYEDPMGQPYNETRIDLEASISGEGTDNLIVVDVIKPIIRLESAQQGISRVVQKGVVIVESNVGQMEMQE